MNDKTKQALELALGALEKLWNIIDDIDTYGDMAKADEKLYRSLVERRQRTRFEETGISTDGYKLNGGAVTAIKEALAEQPSQCQHRITDARNPVVHSGYLCVDCGAIFSAADHAEQPAQQKTEFVSPGGGYVPAIPKPIPLDWKLVPRKATPEMLKAMDECAQEGYDERLYTGMASSVYMAAWDASPVMGTLPEQPAQLDPSVGTQVSKVWWDGNKLMAQPIPLEKLYKEPEQPAQQQEPVAIDRLYIEALIEGLYQNEDPVSIDAAEEFERLLKTPASPPASKPWVELTELEALGAYEAEQQGRWGDHVRGLLAVEAKLREKNT